MDHQTKWAVVPNLLGRPNDILLSVLIKVAFVEGGRIE
jgi:hypothetical protein